MLGTEFFQIYVLSNRSMIEWRFYMTLYWMVVAIDTYLFPRCKDKIFSEIWEVWDNNVGPVEYHGVRYWSRSN